MLKLFVASIALTISLVAAGHWEVSTLAGDGTPAFADGMSTTAKFTKPYSIACDNKGNFYIADTYNHRIRKLAPSDDGNSWQVITIAGDGAAGFADGNGLKTAKFNTPTGIVYDEAGNLYIADAYNDRIRKLAYDQQKESWEVSTIAGGTKGYADGIGTITKFSSPNGIAYDGVGNFYVTDVMNHRIREFDYDKQKESWEVSTIAGSTIGYADGVDTATKFRAPVGIACDNSGNLYVADAYNYRIRQLVYDPQKKIWEVSTIAGSTIGYADGIGTAAKFNNPMSIAYDGKGNLFVADTDNNRIRKLIPSDDGNSWQVVTIAGNGTAGFADGDGLKTAQFRYPNGIACDNKGNIYVADTNNNRIRKLVFVPDNHNPIATPGSIEGNEDSTISGSLLSLVSDGDKDNLIYYSAVKNADGVIIKSPTPEIITSKGGKVTVNTDGTYSYSNQDRYFSGTDSFTYLVEDGHGGATSETITINVRELTMREAAQKICIDPKWVLGYFGRRIAKWFSACI